MRLFDCFVFSDELDLLELRLAVNAPHVDAFVLVESAKTFSGRDKPLTYAENQDRFAPWAGQIRHVVVDDMPPPTKRRWEAEIHQRNAIMRGLVDAADDDVVVIGDADEIAYPEVLASLRRGCKALTGLEMPSSFRYANWELPLGPYADAARAVPYGQLYDPHQQRNHVEPEAVVSRAGRHLTGLGDVSRLAAKFERYSHSEMDTGHHKDLNHLRRAERMGLDPFSCTLASVVEAGELCALQRQLLEQRPDLFDFSALPRGRERMRFRWYARRRARLGGGGRLRRLDERYEDHRLEVDALAAAEACRHLAWGRPRRGLSAAKRRLVRKQKEPRPRGRAKGGEMNVRRRIARKAEVIGKQMFLELDQDPDHAALMLGSGRSGTTWLAECLARQTASRLMFEPFHPQIEHLPGRLPLFLSPESDDKVAERVAREVLSGRVRKRQVDQVLISRLPRSRVVKDVHAGNLLPWFRATFRKLPVVYVVRHPIPASLSRLRAESFYGLAAYLEEPGPRSMAEVSPVAEWLPQFDEYRLHPDPLVRLVAEWCLENVYPLNCIDAGTSLTFYEDAVLRPLEELDRLGRFCASALGEPLPGRVELEDARKPSSKDWFGTAAGADGANSWEKIVGGWRERVTAEQFEACSEVISAFGLEHLYGDAPLPLSSDVPVR